jgi:hypothetical protein
MFDMLIGFVMGGLLSWPGLLTLTLLGVWFEYVESRAWAVFTGLVVAASAYLFFNIAFMDVLVYMGLYLLVGVLWSFWRYKRFVQKRVAIITPLSGASMDWEIKRLHPSENLSTITAWIIIWPFSMVENLCGDIIVAIEDLVRRVFKGVYNRIYESAIADLKK